MRSHIDDVSPCLATGIASLGRVSGRGYSRYGGRLLKNKRLLDRTELFDEISKLPPKAFLRRFVEDASDRVVGVENRLEPHRTQSTRRLHQAVLECLAANESTYKFKPSVALKRHQSLNDLDVQDDDVALADATEQVPAKEADPAENAVAVAVN